MRSFVTLDPRTLGAAAIDSMEAGADEVSFRVDDGERAFSIDAIKCIQVQANTREG